MAILRVYSIFIKMHSFDVLEIYLAIFTYIKNAKQINWKRLPITLDDEGL